MMRKLIRLIIATLLLGGTYTVYGIYSYEPEQLGPPQFGVDPPDPEEVRRVMSNKRKALDMPDDLEAKKKRMATRILPTLKKYKNFIDNTPQSASSMMKILYKLMRNSQMPVFYPDLINTSGREKLNFAELALNRVKAVNVREEGSDDIECNQSSGDSYNILVGSARDNTLSCRSNSSIGGDVRIYIAGPGDDQIEDNDGHAIINAGTGNDVVKTGRGSAIIYIEAGWGRNTLNVPCANTSLDPDRFPEEMPGPWPYKYANFLVFAPGIAPEDILYKDGIVRHRNADDRLILNENCFNFVFTDALSRK